MLHDAHSSKIKTKIESKRYQNLLYHYFKRQQLLQCRPQHLFVSFMLDNILIIRNYDLNKITLNLFLISISIIASAGSYCTPTKGLASNRNFTKELLSYTESIQICVMARGETKANGFAYNSKTGECFGITNAHAIDKKETFWESCIFTSKFLTEQNVCGQ